MGEAISQHVTIHMVALMVNLQTAITLWVLTSHTCLRPVGQHIMDSLLAVTNSSSHYKLICRTSSESCLSLYKWTVFSAAKSHKASSA